MPSSLIPKTFPYLVTTANIPLLGREAVHTQNRSAPPLSNSHHTVTLSGLFRKHCEPIWTAESTCHELEDTDTDTPLIKVVSKRILVEFLGIREESCLLYLWGMNPLALI